MTDTLYRTAQKEVAKCRGSCKSETKERDARGATIGLPELSDMLLRSAI